MLSNIGLPELYSVARPQNGTPWSDGGNAQAVVEMAIGGRAATTFYEDDRMFDVRIRFKKNTEMTTKIGNI